VLKCRQLSAKRVERSARIRIVLGLLLLLLFVGTSVGGLILVQRLVPIERREAHNDVAGFIYAVLGVAYAVLLGLMVIAVWDDYKDAQSAATEEANELAAIFWIAHGLPEPQAGRIQELTHEYASVVVHEEWPLMAKGRSSPRAWQILDELRASVEALHPTTDTQLVLYDNEIQRLHDLGDARRARLLQVHEGLPTILWVVLLIGGVVEVGFTYLFGLRSTTVHVLMVAALAMIIGLVLFTIGALEFPFKGDVRVTPEAFESVLDRFSDSKLSKL
jgi:protein-S-isoprenylcysteine O-methyltransferase Ste14